MLEVEMKFWVDNPQEVKASLHKLGAEFIATEEQIDLYLNHPCRDFATTDEAIRLRKSKGRVELTYKGRKLDSITKTREEISAKVENFHEILKIFKKLGFKEAGKIVKKREIYRVGEFVVMIDSVEKLGIFVEIEKKAESYSPEELLEFGEKLGLKREKAERKSYLELVLEAEKCL